MTILEKPENPAQTRQWTDNIPTKYLYSYGVAGEKFFREIKENGRLLTATCKSCKITYLPPRIFCEKCFQELDDWKHISSEGEVYAYTIGHITPDGAKRSAPQVLAFIRFKGVKGGLVHRLNVPVNRAKIGLSVRAVFKPKPERTGSILDIAYFEPAVLAK